MRRIAIVAGAAAVLLAAGVATAGEGLLGRLQDEIRELVSRTAPAVVKVTAERESEPRMLMPIPKGFPSFDALLERSNTVGTGFLVGRGGFVLTTDRIAHAADRVRVDLVDGRSLSGEVVGSDPFFKLGVLRVDPPDGVEPLDLAPGEGRVPLGSVGVFVGHSHGVSTNLAFTLVAGSRRHFESGASSYDNYLVWNAPVQPGDSGGPYVDPEGRVLGMAVGSHAGAFRIEAGGGPGGIRIQDMSSSAGTALAVPAEDIRFAFEQIRLHGRVPSARLGVRIRTGTLEVGQVVPASPAEAAGIRAADSLLGIGGHPLGSGADLLFRLRRLPVGVPVTLSLRRGEEELSLDCELEDALTGLDTAIPGIRIETVQGRLFVRSVSEGAETAGISAGDEILALSGVRVGSPAELLRVAASFDDGPVTVVVRRGRGLLRFELPR